MADDLVSFGSGKGLFDEAGVRAFFGGEPPKAEDLISNGFLEADDLAGLLKDYHQSIRQAPRPSVCCGTCGKPMVHKDGAIVCDACGLRLVVDTAKPLADAEPPEVTEAAAVAANVFGPYVLLRKIGEGGFGTVMLAWDRKIGRKVALKILNTTDPDELLRFRREAQLAGSLRHPNIAAVYDVGEAAGKTFLAMEYIDGRPLGSEELPLPKTLGLVRDVSRAIHHAHQQGIVHRDIKPGNVMVDGAGRAFVLDFGLARRVEGSSITVTGTIMGTPAFMSPEQAGGNPVDARSDVYSLGAMLYMLATKLPPFNGGAAQVLSMVLHDDPIPPRKLDRSIPVEIEVVIQKAMAKEAAHRYASAAALAEDLDRFLRGEVIAARPSSIVYRLRKRVRRNPWTWALGAAFVAALFGGAAFGVYYLLKANANLERALAEARSREAQAKAQRLVDEARAILSEVDRAMYIEGCSLQPYFDALEASRARCREALAVAPGFASAWHWIGKAYLMEGLGEAAVEALEHAAAGPKTPGPVWAELGRARIVRGIDRALYSATRDESARALEEAATSAMTAYDRMGETGEGIDRVVAEAWRMHAQGRLQELADFIGKEWKTFGGRPGSEELAYILGTMTRGQEQIGYYEQAIRIRPGHFLAHLGLGYARRELGDHAGAEAAYADAIRVNPRFAAAFNNRSSTRKDLRDYAGSIADAERAMELRPGFGNAFYNRATCRLALGDLDEAIADYTEAVRLRPNYPDAFVDRGLVWKRKGDVKRAVADYEEAMRLDPRLARAWHERGVVRQEGGDLEGAASDYTEVIALDTSFVDAYNNLGNIRKEQGDLDGAFAAYAEAIRANPRYPQSYYNRGNAWYAQGDMEKAVEDYSRAIDANPDFAEAYGNRAAMRQLTGDFEGSRSDLREAIRCASANPALRAGFEESLRRLESAAPRDF